MMVLKKFARTVFLVCLGLLCAGNTRAQTMPSDPEYSAFLRTVAAVPLSLQVSGDLGNHVGLHVGASLYPVPLIVESAFNMDGFANVVYSFSKSSGDRVARATLSGYAGLGPRFSLVSGELMGGADGSYLGGGVVLGAQLNLSVIGINLVNLFFEGSFDLTFGITDGASPSRFSPRVRIGLGIPIGGASVQGGTP